MSTSQAKILLVEDDDNIRELVTINLKHSGLDVAAFFSVEHLEKSVENISQYDLLILDIMLPGRSGLEFASQLKQDSLMIPILFISALSQEDKINKAYESGAIDYIIKPFDIDNLLAKINNLLFYFIKREEKKLPSTIGRATINWQLMTVQHANEEFKLTVKEGQVLSHFLRNPERVISRNEIIETFWGKDVYVTNRTIDNFIVKFRRMFEINPASPKYFITYPKQGYAYLSESS